MVAQKSGEPTSRFFGRKRPRAPQERTLTRYSAAPLMQTPTAAAAPVSAHTALSIADAYACVRALADAAASLPLIVYRRSDRGRQRIEGRTADLLERRPAPAVTRPSFVGQIVATLNLSGNAYVGKFKNADGQIEQLGLLPPDRVTPELLPGGVPRYTFLHDDGRVTTHGTDDVIHIKAMTTDGLTGLSPVRQCREALGLSAALVRHATTFMENDARPSGILRVGGPGTLPGSTDQMEEVADTWLDQHRGVSKANRIAVMTGDVDWTPLSFSPDDANFLEQRKLSATEVARIFRVPPWIIGADSGDSMTYSNVESQSLAFVTYSLRPWLVAIEQALSADQDLFTRNTYCEFLLDALLRSDSLTRAQVYTAALNPDTGWMTRAEVRRLENLAPESA